MRVSAALAIRNKSLRHVARADLDVTFITACVDPAVGNCVFYGAIVFVRVRAIGEAAAAYIGSQLAEEAGDLFGNHVPELELADARRVDDVAAEGEWN